MAADITIYRHLLLNGMLGPFPHTTVSRKSAFSRLGADGGRRRRAHRPPPISMLLADLEDQECSLMWLVDSHRECFTPPIDRQLRGGKVGIVDIVKSGDYDTKASTKYRVPGKKV